MLRRFAAALRRRSPRLIAGAAIIALAVTGAVVLPTSLASASPVNIWSDNSPRGTQLEVDRKSVELGTKFTPAVDGTALGIRFYKLAGTKGKHTGTLWTASGKKLATVTFSSESSAGWQTAKLSEGVSLKAGATYVVSYRAPARGGYAAVRNHTFKSATPAVSVDKRNVGVHSYGKPGTFPRKTWHSSQYWVDVVFKPKWPVASTSPSISPTPTATANPSPKPTRTQSATPSPTPTVTPSTTPSPTASQAPAPPPATNNPTPTVPSTPTVPPATPSANGFPTRENTGVPAGWTPKHTVTGDYVITTPGAVVEDLQVTNGVLYVRAQNVTLRRVQLVSARIVNEYAGRCYGGTLIEDTTIVRGPQDVWQPVIQSGGYTAKRVKLDGVSEGFRIAGGDVGCGPVLIEDSWVQVDPTVGCDRPGVDWHGDGLQGYWGVPVTVRNSTITITRTAYCQGTAAFFYPDQYNVSATIENVLLSGGAYVFRLGTPGSVSGLKIVDDSWEYGPVDVTSCSRVTWGSGNELVRVNQNGSLTSVAPLRCQGW